MALGASAGGAGLAGAPVEAAAALAAAPRRRLLDLLRAAEPDGGPYAGLDAHELAAAVGLHVTTVRFHLDLLRRAGLVTAAARRGTGAGRPRLVYSALATAAPAGYPALAGVLAAHLADTPRERTARAERAGLDWAAQLTPPPGRTRLDAEATARAVTAVFTELGFDPALTGGRGARRIELRACPFRDTARASPEVVCAVHFGLLCGVVARLGGPPLVPALRPFVAPELCVAELTLAG